MDGILRVRDLKEILERFDDDLPVLTTGMMGGYTELSPRCVRSMAIYSRLRPVGVPERPKGGGWDALVISG